MNEHSFLAPRPENHQIFDCLTCDGLLINISGTGNYWRDSPEAPLVPYPIGRSCLHTRDRKAEEHQKMIYAFRASDKSLWINGAPPGAETP